MAWLTLTPCAKHDAACLAAPLCLQVVLAAIPALVVVGAICGIFTACLQVCPGSCTI